MGKIATLGLKHSKGCPDCGTTTLMHYSWCRIHLMPIKKEDKK